MPFVQIREGAKFTPPKKTTTLLNSYAPQLTDIEEQLETDSIPIKEEEEEDLPEDIDESEQSSEKEEKPTMPFGDFLDLMEVF